MAIIIGRARRALIYIDAPWSIDAVKGRRLFLDAAFQLSADHADLGVEFLHIRDENDDDCIEWLKTLNDDRLPPLGNPGGYGGLIWLERGRVVGAEPYAGKLSSGRAVIEQTMRLWPQ